MELVSSYVKGDERVQFCTPNIMEAVVTEFGFHDFTVRHRADAPLSFHSYVLHYTKSGCGTFVFRDKAYHITKNTFIFVPPGCEIHLVPDSDDPWKYYWMVCHGKDMPTLFANAQFSIDDPIYQCPDPPKIQAIIDDLFDLTASPAAPCHVFALAAFMNILGIITTERTASAETPNLSSSKSYYVQRILDIIENNYKDSTLRIETICKELFIHHSYACRIFKEYANCTIMNYIITHRMREAEILLKYTKLSIEQIAYNVGYRDSFHFSKAFTKHFEISPNQYRKKYWMVR